MALIRGLAHSGISNLLVDELPTEGAVMTAAPRTDCEASLNIPRRGNSYAEAQHALVRGDDWLFYGR